MAEKTESQRADTISYPDEAFFEDTETPAFDFGDEEWSDLVKAATPFGVLGREVEA